MAKNNSKTLGPGLNPLEARSITKGIHYFCVSRNCQISCTRRECIRLLYSLLRLSDRNDESIASHHALSQAHSLEIILAATFSPIPDSVIALMKVSRPNPLFLPPTSKVIAISSVSFLSARRTDNRSYAGARRYSPMPFSSIREKFE